MTIRVTILLATIFFSMNSWAAIDAYEFPNAELEERYHHLISELRCPQCLNTNLAGSDAMIAQDLRREVQEQLLAGKSDSEILDFMLVRYGDFVLYRPRLKPGTIFLWAGPVLVLLLGLFLVGRVLLRAKSDFQSPVEMTAEDETRLEALLQDKFEHKSREVE